MSIDHNSLSVAKIAKPRLPRIFHRESCYNLLDGSREFPSVWIAGPAGSGKTSLVAGYVSRRKTPCLWYQLDQGDTDPATFFHYMGLAIQHASGSDTIPVPLFTAEYTQGILSFSRRFFESLYSQLGPNHCIVLDNYQEIDPESTLHLVVCQAPCGLATGPQSHYFEQGNLPHGIFSRATTNRIMTTVGWDRIRLTENETGAIASLQLGEDLPEAVVNRLHRVSDGWVAGLILMLSSGGDSKGLEQNITNQSPHEIFEYLAREVFDAIDPRYPGTSFQNSSFSPYDIPNGRSLHGPDPCGPGFFHSP